MSGLLKIIPVYDNVEDAIKNVKGNKMQPINEMNLEFSVNQEMKVLQGCCSGFCIATESYKNWQMLKLQFQKR